MKSGMEIRGRPSQTTEVKRMRRHVHGCLKIVVSPVRAWVSPSRRPRRRRGLVVFGGPLGSSQRPLEISGAHATRQTMRDVAWPATHLGMAPAHVLRPSNPPA